jgi:beta-D-xylosidase 4
MKSPQLFRVGTSVLLYLIVPHTGVHGSSSIWGVNDSVPTTAYQASTSYLGCYLDPKVTILTAAKLNTIGMTPQYCANWCGQRGFEYGGIEFGT